MPQLVNLDRRRKSGTLEGLLEPAMNACGVKRSGRIGLRIEEKLRGVAPSRCSPCPARVATWGGEARDDSDETGAIISREGEAVRYCVTARLTSADSERSFTRARSLRPSRSREGMTAEIFGTSALSERADKRSRGKRSRDARRRRDLRG